MFDPLVKISTPGGIGRASLMLAVLCLGLTACTQGKAPEAKPQPVTPSIKPIAPIKVTAPPPNDAKTEDNKYLALYNRIIADNPGDYVALYRRGKYKEAMKDDKGALADFEQSIKVNPLQSDHPGINSTPDERTLRAWSNQDGGYMLCMHGRFREGAAALSHAITLRPNYADNYQNRGAAYRQLGLIGLAKQDFAKAEYLRKANLPDLCLTAPTMLSTSEHSAQDMTQPVSKHNAD